MVFSSFMSWTLLYIFVSYPYPGSEGHFLLWSVQIQGSDLTLDFAVECGFPELLVGPDGMVLNAGVGKLVDPWSQFLKANKHLF